MNGDAYDDSFRSAPRAQARSWRVLEGSSDRKLPHSIEAEEYLIAAILIDPEQVIARCELMQLTPEAFYELKHGVVYEVARDLWRKNLPVSAATVAEELKLRKKLDAIGGYPFIVQVSEKVSTTAEAVFHLEKVFEFGLVRAFVRDVAAAAEDGYGYVGGLDELLGRHATKLQRLADFALGRRRRPQREIAAEARAYALAAMEGRLDKSRIMPLGGLPQTTAAFLPFDVREEDWLILIGALRNVGKSTIARQHVGHNLVAGKRFVVFLLETSKRRWLNALAAMFAGVNLRELEETRALFPARTKLFDEWMAWIESIMEEQLWIFDDVFYLEDIERQIREINRRVRERQLTAAIKEGKTPEEAEKAAYGLDGVMGDHIHLVLTRKDFRNNRQNELSYIGRRLKLMAKALDLPNFWCAQLNRAASNDERRPRVSDLRDSGTLENDADCVLLLHKPAENKAGAKQAGDQSVHEVELIQGKRRNGPAGVMVDLLHHLKLGSYEELTKDAVKPGMPKPSSGYKREES